MHIARSSPYGGGVFVGPGQRPPDRDPPDRDPPGQRPYPWTETPPPEVTWDQAQRPLGWNMGPGSQTGSDLIQRPPSPR